MGNEEEAAAVGVDKVLTISSTAVLVVVVIEVGKGVANDMSSESSLLNKQTQRKINDVCENYFCVCVCIQNWR